MKPTLTRILDRVNDPAYRAKAYKDVRKRWRGVTALCAATQSWLLFSIGAIRVHEDNCGELTKRLKANGWQKCYSWSDIVPGCLCFAIDWNDGKPNGVSDHVYTFIKWLDFDKRMALIYDNHSKDPAPRNLGNRVIWNGRWFSRLRFWYCMTPPT